MVRGGIETTWGDGRIGARAAAKLGSIEALYMARRAW